MNKPPEKQGCIVGNECVRQEDFEKFKDDSAKIHSQLFQDIINMELNIFKKVGDSENGIFKKISDTAKWGLGLFCTCTTVFLVAFLGWYFTREGSQDESMKAMDVSVHEMRKQQALTALTVDNAVKTLVKSVDHVDADLRDLAERTSKQVEMTTADLKEHEKMTEHRK